MHFSTRSIFRRQIIGIASISKHRLSVISHVDVKNNTPKMVDVSGKLPSPRIAHARVRQILSITIKGLHLLSFIQKYLYI